MAKDKKICPLTYTSRKGAYDQQQGDFAYCEEVNCAWWDILAGDCAIVVIAKLGLEGSFNAITRGVKK